MHYPDDRYTSFCNTVCLCGCTDVEREGKKSYKLIEMQYLKHLHEDLKFEHLYPIFYVENTGMTNLNIPGFFDPRSF